MPFPYTGEKMKREDFELLAPAGDLEKLKIAIIYGADAVYFGGEMFSLRAGAGNLTIEEMKEGTAFAHERGKRCYLTVNIFAHNEDIDPLTEYLQKIREVDIDGFIVSDPGVIDLIREIIPDAEIHLSTQANMTNFRTAGFWYKMGVKRLVLARELTFRRSARYGTISLRTWSWRLSFTEPCAFPIPAGVF